MEYGGTNTLKQYLQDKKEKGVKLYELESKGIFRQLVSAIAYLHNLDLVHLDLKLENILLLEPVRKEQEWQVKLIDFGFSRISKNKQKLEFICGTPNYMCPELLGKQSYLGQAADVWALGVILFLLLKQEFPFKGNTEQELLKNILAGNMCQVGQQGGKEAKQLLSYIFQNNQQSRPSCQDILQHPWLSS